MEAHKVTAGGAYGYSSSIAVNGSSLSQSKQENISSKRLTQMELQERDRNGIRYSKTLLEEGDTLIYISYPPNTQIYDHTGFPLKCGQPLKVHSYKLLGTGSEVFAKLFEEWQQHRFKRKHGYLKGLPEGIKFLLDLTPPDEGDEAVTLLSDLSCSPGIRNWFSAEQRCNVPAIVCGGRDPLIKPLKPEPKYKKYIDMAEKVTDDNGLETNLVNEMENYEIEVGPEEDEGIEVANRNPGRRAAVPRGYEQQLQEALQRSKMELFNHQPTPEPNSEASRQIVEDVAEYCSVRHRLGIEALLQLIEGHEPTLDSAPKVWTIAVLAKYFDCTKSVVDYISSWVLRSPNCQFIEILPEATMRMGFDLKSSMLIRPAFAILVSEEALNICSRECKGQDAEKVGTNQFGRKREQIDEDITSAVQEAARSLVGRIENVMEALLEPQMIWMSELPELQKIKRLRTWAENSYISKEQKHLFFKYASSLERCLAHFVRGRILWAFNRDLSVGQNVAANDRRRAETYLKKYNSDFHVDVYSSMAEKEKILTRFCWAELKNLHLNTSCDSNLLFDEIGLEPTIIAKHRMIADSRRIEPVKMFELVTLQADLNEGILASIQIYDYNFGRLPEECFPRVTTSVKHELDDWGFAPTFHAPLFAQKKPRFEPRFRSADDVFQAGTSDELHDFLDGPDDFLSNQYLFDLEFDEKDGVLETKNIDSLAASTNEKLIEVDFKEEDNVLGTSGGVSSVASTKSLYDFPLRPKSLAGTDELPLLPKRPNPFTSGAEVFGSSPIKGSGSSLTNRISNIMKAATKFLATEHTLADPREGAVKLHSRNDTVTVADLSSSVTQHIPRTVGKDSRTPNASKPPANRKGKEPEQPTGILKARVPSDSFIDENSPFFNLDQYFAQARKEIVRRCNDLLRNADELDFTVLTDTLLCLTDDEWKFLPLWAGGNEDGTGGVFAPMIPPAPPGAGPSGPGPAFHTGYSMPSRASTDGDFDDDSTVGYSTVDDSINTVAVENGFSDHVNRRRVMTEDEIMSEQFSDDTEDYDGKTKEYVHDKEVDGNMSEPHQEYVDKGKGKEVLDAIHDYAPAQTDIEAPNTSFDDDFIWDGSDEEEAFNFGDDDDDDDLDGNETETE